MQFLLNGPWWRDDIKVDEEISGARSKGVDRVDEFRCVPHVMWITSNVCSKQAGQILGQAVGRGPDGTRDVAERYPFLLDLRILSKDPTEAIERNTTLLFKKSSLSEEFVQQLRSRGSRPPRPYSLLKIHKEVFNFNSTVCIDVMWVHTFPSIPYVF